jgi:putative ABC transport system substrate-binding protein
MRRRDFIGAFGGVAVWPLAARAQQAEKIRRVGILTGAANDVEGQGRIATFRRGLEGLGWVEGRNVQIVERWAAGETSSIRAQVTELLDLKAEVILGTGARVWQALRQQAKSIPVVNIGVPATLMGNLAQPGGNVTGFTIFEQSLVGKLTGTLKEAAPHARRIALLISRDHPNLAEYSKFFEITAPTLEAKPIVVRVGDRTAIERAFDELALEPNVAVVMPPDIFVAAQRDLLLALTARHRMPFISVYRTLTSAGALMSYGPDIPEMYRRAAGYVDRILRGERPSDLPIQTPTKFELVVNLKTAKALGITIPASVLARADEVIE